MGEAAKERHAAFFAWSTVLRCVKNRLPISTGWAEAARKMRELGEDQLITSTQFDREEWEWR